MSNYTKITDYAAKDLLLHLDPLKAVKGSEVGAEFDAIATMSATKTDAATLAAAGGAALVGNTPAGNIAATTVQAAINELDSEKAKVGTLASSGITGAAASGANADITSMTGLTAPTVAANPVRATDLQAQTVTAFTTGGTATAFTLTPTPALAALATNQRFRITFNAAAGATPTLAVSGLTAKNLKYKDSTGAKQAITSAQVPSGWVSDVEYDGTDYVVENVALQKGTATNDAAAAGYIGEYIESAQTTSVNAPASSTWGDITSISLTAGDWDVSLFVTVSLNTGVSVTRVQAGIGSVTGNNSSFLTQGDTLCDLIPPTANYNGSMTIPSKRILLAAPATYYAKCWINYSSGIPQFVGRISATRRR